MKAKWDKRAALRGVRDILRESRLFILFVFVSRLLLSQPLTRTVGANVIEATKVTDCGVLCRG